MLERLKNEPVLISAAVIAVGNLFGHDLSEWEGIIQSAGLLVVGLVTRHFVTPARKT